jgi:hypothetical protein
VVEENHEIPDVCWPRCLISEPVDRDFRVDVPVYAMPQVSVRNSFDR